MFSLLKRRAQASDGGAGLFGKIATASDFVSAGDYSPAAGNLSRWLEEGVGWAATHAKTEWEGLSGRGPRAFVFHPDIGERNDRVVVGLLQPSIDAVGRRFPLAIYSELAVGGESDSFSLLPIAAGDFLSSALDILAAADKGEDPRHRLRSVAPDIAARLSVARTEFNDWAHATQVQVLFSTFWSEDSTNKAIAAFSNLFEILSPLRSAEKGVSPITLRLPLVHAGVAGAVFWLEVIRRCLRWRRQAPSAFWHFCVQSGAMHVPLGNPQPRTLLGLWVEDHQDDSLCDLTQPVSAGFQLPPKMLQAVSATGTVTEFLKALSA